MITGTTSSYSRQVVLLWFATALLLQTAACVAFRLISHVRHASSSTNLPVLVVGSGSLARRLIDSINRNIFLADHVMGVVDDAHQLANWPRKSRDVPALGTFDELSNIVAQHAIERVYIALPLEAGGDVARLHRQLQRHNVDLIWVQDVFALELLNPRVREISSIPLISLSETPLNSGAWAYLKTLMDVVLASLALVLLSPVMIASAVAIKLTSRGPILYRQTRTGWAQIHGHRGETATVDQMRRRVEYDVDYINRCSLMLDVRILLCTPFALFSRKAY